MAASPEAKFTEEKILWVKHHTPKLITFAISRPESYRFKAGQFSRLGFYEGKGFIWRAYSVVSAEYADTLEYFAVLIQDGPCRPFSPKCNRATPSCSIKMPLAFSCPNASPTARIW